MRIGLRSSGKLILDLGPEKGQYPTEKGPVGRAFPTELFAAQSFNPYPFAADDLHASSQREVRPA